MAVQLQRNNRFRFNDLNSELILLLSYFFGKNRSETGCFLYYRCLTEKNN